MTVDALPNTPASPKPNAPAAARGLALTVTPKRDRSAPYRFAVSGKLLLPSTVTTATGCTARSTSMPS